MCTCQSLHHCYSYYVKLPKLLGIHLQVITDSNFVISNVSWHVETVTVPQIAT